VRSLMEIAREFHRQHPPEPSNEGEATNHTAPPDSVAPGPAGDPELYCFACHGRDFWQGEPIRYAVGSSEPAPWICTRCHPRPNTGRRELEYERRTF
jgi:hypothetical protein